MSAVCGFNFIDFKWGDMMSSLLSCVVVYFLTPKAKTWALLNVQEKNKKIWHENIFTKFIHPIEQ